MEKIAIIDIGSNTARIVIANILDGGYFNVIDELKEPVRIAKGMELDGYLRPVRIQQMIKTLKNFKKSQGRQGFRLRHGFIAPREKQEDFRRRSSF